MKKIFLKKMKKSVDNITLLCYNVYRNEGKVCENMKNVFIDLKLNYDYNKGMLMYYNEYHSNIVVSKELGRVVIGEVKEIKYRTDYTNKMAIYITFMSNIENRKTKKEETLMFYLNDISEIVIN